MRELGLSDLEQVDGGIALGATSLAGVGSTGSTLTTPQPFGPDPFGLPAALDFGAGGLNNLLSNPAIGGVVNQFLSNPTVQGVLDELRDANPQVAGFIDRLSNGGLANALNFVPQGNAPFTTGLPPLPGLLPGLAALPGLNGAPPIPFAPPINFGAGQPVLDPLAPVGSISVGPGQGSYNFQSNGPNGTSSYSYSYSYSSSSSSGAPQGGLALDPAAGVGTVTAGSTPI